METSLLPVKGCKFWHILVSYGHWAVSVFSMSHLRWSSLRTHVMTLTEPSVWKKSCNYLDLSRLGFEHPIFRLRGEHSYRLRHLLFRSAREFIQTYAFILKFYMILWIFHVFLKIRREKNVTKIAEVKLIQWKQRDLMVYMWIKLWRKKISICFILQFWCLTKPLRIG